MPPVVNAGGFFMGFTMADYYGTVAGFKAYHSERGRATLIADFDDPEIEAALLIASEWLDGRYFASFAGFKTGGRDQVRQWPRYNTFDNEDHSLPSDAVPREVEQATYEATLVQLVTPGSFNVSYTPNKYKMARVEGAVSVEFAQFSSAYDIQTQLPVIDQILAPIMSGYGNGNFSGFSGAGVRV